MENTEFEEHLDSSTAPTRRSGKSSESSQKRTRKHSTPGAAAEDGLSPEQRRELYDLLLTQLQSLLTDIKGAGVTIKLHRGTAGFIIVLPDVSICQDHQMLHSGEKCPYPHS